MESTSFADSYELYVESKMNFDDFQLNTFGGEYDNEGYLADHVRRAPSPVLDNTSSSQYNVSNNSEEEAEPPQGDRMNSADQAASLCAEVINCDGSRMWACQAVNCEKICTRKCNLISHIQNKHVVHGKSFRCSQCDLKFARNAEAKRHENTHNVGKPHACKNCTKSFRRLADLNRHLKICKNKLSMAVATYGGAGGNSGGKKTVKSISGEQAGVKAGGRK